MSMKPAFSVVLPTEKEPLNVELLNLCYSVFFVGSGNIKLILQDLGRRNSTETLHTNQTNVLYLLRYNSNHKFRFKRVLVVTFVYFV